MTALIKVKVQRKAIVKLKVLTLFPSDVVADPGIIITRLGRTYTFSLDPAALPSANLQALADNTGTGIWTVTGVGTGHVRTITGTAGEITVTNGDGVAGNPAISIPTTLVWAGKALQGGSVISLANLSLVNNGFQHRIASGGTLTADRTLTLDLGNASVNVSFNGNVAFGGNFSTANNVAFSGAFGSTFTVTGTTTVTFPTIGTLATTGNLSQFAATTSAQLAGVISDETGSGALVFANSPALVTPNLGTPSAAVLTSATGLPIGTGVSGLAAGVATFLGTPSSANLRAALTDEVGTGAAYFVGGALGTPASGTLTNATGLPLSGLTTQAAFTFVGNNTSGAAVPTAVSIPGLTTKASPVAGDLIMIADSAASNAWKQTTVSALASAGSVASIAGNTGAFTLSHGITNSGNDIRLGQFFCIVNLASDQSVTTATKTKIQFANELNDPQGWFDNVTNFRFTPLVAGTYDVTVTLCVSASGALTGNQLVMIYKNGVEVVECLFPSTLPTTISINYLVTMNGSTDYLEGWGRCTSASSPVFSGGTGPLFTYMTIKLVGA